MISRAIPFVLFVLFCSLAIVSLLRLKDAPRADSPWIGHQAPALAAPLFSLNDGVSTRATPVLAPRVTLINIFASWCGPCIAEHPLLSQIAGDARIDVVGIAWNDKQDTLRAFLHEHGNPYTRIYMDKGTGTGLALGIRGVPETFIVDAEGIIRYHVPGPLSQQMIDDDVLPLLERLIP